MKTLISLVLSAFILISIALAVNAGQHEHTAHAQHADHACPMHPEVTGEKGDTCPKCGMNLTKVESSHSKHKAGCGEDCKSCPNHANKHAAKHSADTHACPMNPAITGKAGDTCHKCGMNLETIQQAKADTHACPMNPAITGKKGDTCPKCGMNLEPVQAKADTKPAVHHKH